MWNGEVIERNAGTPQGGVISPVLANMFLHYVFDMRSNFIASVSKTSAKTFRDKIKSLEIHKKNGSCL